MCMRKCFLRIGGRIFNLLVILGFFAGGISAVFSGIGASAPANGGTIMEGWITGISQLILSWSGTLVIALIVYALLDIAESLNKCDNSKAHNCCDHQH